jgi:hypothetical protein
MLAESPEKDSISVTAENEKATKLKKFAPSTDPER